MPKTIKANKFTRENIVKSSKRKPSAHVKNGIPVKTNALGTKVIDGYRKLAEKDYLSNDNVLNTSDTSISILSLEALGVVVEPINSDQDEMTFYTYQTSKPINKADENSKMENKNYGDNVFPDRNDPIYEMDEAIPDYVQGENVTISPQQADGRVITELFYQISDINLNLRENAKLKQYSEN